MKVKIMKRLKLCFGLVLAIALVTPAHAEDWTLKKVPVYSANHITTKTTTTVTSTTAYVSAIGICVTGAGTTQTLTIQNKEGTAKVLYTAGTAIAVGNTYIQFEVPIVMTGGIDIVTGGTTAGTQDVFITYWQ